MKRKRILSCILVMVLVLTSLWIPQPEKNRAATISVKYGGKTYTYATKKQTTAYVNGKKISTKMPGVIINNTNVVPVKVFRHASLGISYSYDSSKKVVTLKKNKTTIKITMGSKTAKVNGKNVTMTTKAERMYLVSQKTYYLMIPARFVAERLGFTY